MTMSQLGRHGLCFLLVSFLSISMIGCGDPQENQKQGNSNVNSLSNQMLPSGSMPDGVYWGDLHVHSRLSMDSFSFGNRMMTADDAFKFAKGEPVEAHTGDIAQLRKPLDFLLVSGFPWERSAVSAKTGQVTGKRPKKLDTSLPRR